MKAAVVALESARQDPGINAAERDANGVQRPPVSLRIGISALDALQVSAPAATNGFNSSIHCSSHPHSLTAGGGVKQGAMRVPIPTRVGELDAILGGGVACGELTEICA